MATSTPATTHSDLSGRIARFAELRPIVEQQDPAIPQEALDIIYARRLLPVIDLGAGMETAVAKAAPISGAAGMTMTLAVCPPGQGPDLHAHKATYETFTVLQGEFEFRWGEQGENHAKLTRFDTLSVPPGYYRAFRNIGQVEGILQVLISGGLHDASDIVMPKHLAEKLRDASPRLYRRIQEAGVQFSNGISIAALPE